MTKVLLASLPLVFLIGCTQAPAPTVDRTPTARAQAASTVPGPNEYLVKRGDTLFRIAREHGLNHVELAALNNIDNPSALREGQVIRLRADRPAPGGAVVASPVGTVSGVEVRPLGGTADGAADASTPALLREPKGGKEPYSDEAHARLNRIQVAPPAAPAVADTPPPTQAPAAAPVSAETATVGGLVWGWPTTARVSAGYNESTNKGYDFAGKLGDPVVSAGEGRVLYVGDALAGYGKLIIVKHSNDFLSVYAHNSKVLVKEGQAVRLGQKIAEMGSTGTDSVKLHFEIRRQGKPVDPTPFLPKR